MAFDLYAISPSGAVQDRTRMERAAARLADAGIGVRFDRTAFSRAQRFAGTDAQRAAAFGRAAAQRAPVVMITRGGYGLTRYLDALDYEALAASGKKWVGVSDFTAFQLAMLARAGAVTWAGPALTDFGAEDGVDGTTRDAFGEAMRGELEVLGFGYSGPKDVEARGTLWGGNLSVLCALLGTPWFPQVRRGILFVEDVNEHPYRIERMLTQLLHAGVIDAQSAVLVGQVSRYRLAEHDRGFDMPAVLRFLRGRTRTPILAGLPYGHEMPCMTLPHGAKVSLATEGRTCWLRLPHAH
ncbi:MAG: LD-carboxypeptidase [Burkholderiales bacterium]